MNTIENTYAGSFNAYDALRGQLQASRPVSGNTGKNGDATAAPKAPAYDSRQQGITSDSSSQKEYQTYGPDGRISSKPDARQPPKETSAKVQGNASKDSSDQTEDLQVQQEIARLKRTEEKVKAHEAAHKSAGGGITGPVSYTYTRGPDDRSYVTGGEVPITVSTGHTPQETINRMQQVIRAAMAPADPSPQDRAVAAQASNIMQQARQEMASATLANSTETEDVSSATDMNTLPQDSGNAPRPYADPGVYAASDSRPIDSSVSFYA